MFKAHERKDVYIIEKIVKDLDKFVLFSAIRYNFTSSINTNTVFLNMNDVFKSAFTNLINVDTNLTNVANKSIVINKINYNQFIIKMYKL